MRDFVCVCLVGFVDGIVLVDFSYVEEVVGGFQLVLVLLLVLGQIVLFEMDVWLYEDYLEWVLEVVVQVV